MIDTTNTNSFTHVHVSRRTHFYLQYYKTYDEGGWGGAGPPLGRPLYTYKILIPDLCFYTLDLHRKIIL